MKDNRFIRVCLAILFFCASSYAGRFYVCAAAEENYLETEAMVFFEQDRPRRHLVARLYRAGAVYLGVVFVKEEASGLKIYLPLRRELREAIFKIANEALVQAGFRREEDERQDTLMVWFK